ncbi:vitamin B12 ABC transporter permease BtuC [Xenorhabdus sp. Reich]|uniref:Vitamin B12 import system permease protein BtuC n=1 Tax=Xenorhabdus littoralis TaxID=2582835 RepID=A0ABU4SL94_9GAMM|nr:MULTISPECIES: vitamin B12 ABC transporter permease BtuC [unclassified Xenorhabdus]MDX7990376.1 vitamin B12 ABC transporter permease BtuC [Xenorhabdus sp. psl]MDX7999419.1 vitamin B12 ABC transporter permease BtuC [Xenorhabdus sp. Reich]
MNSVYDLLTYQRKRDHRVMAVLSIFFITLFVFSLCSGEIWFWPNEWLSDSAQLFIWQLRLPRAIAVMVVGASLAVSGAVMQALFENPLAEPGLLGISNGAGVVVVGLILAFHGIAPLWLLSIGAVLGALFMTAILLGFSRRHHVTNARLLLIGVAFGVIFGALMTWMVYFSTSLDLRQLMYWMMGSFSGIDWRQKWLAIALIPAIFWLSSKGRILNYLSLGELQSRQLGISHHKWRNLFVSIVGLLVGLSVALAGAISFIGLVIPHILRLVGLTDHKTLLPASALAGSSGLLLADLFSRLSLSHAEVPIGVVTVTLGAPIFIWLLLRTHHR